ncbi:MAG: hypothetical protein AAF460_10180 [Pseudomonadota bacterium]
MTRDLTSTYWCWFWLALRAVLQCIAVLGSVAAHAQLQRADQQIEIDAHIGFQQQVVIDTWTPITITVRNHGPAVTGALDVVTTDASPRGDYPTHYRQPLTLARGAQKRVQFTVFLSRIAVPVDIRVIGDGGEVVASQSLDLRTQTSRQRFVVALGRDANLGYLNDRDQHQLGVVYPLAEFLPAHWLGYDSVEAVVLHRVSLRRLTDQQIQALRKWVAAGGRLLVSGGHDTAMLQAPQLTAVLPARIQGTRTVSDTSTLHTALDSEWPVPTGSSPLILTHLHPKPASVSTLVLRGADDLPLVVEAATGRGRVVLTAFDIASEPFESWRGIRELMFRLLQPRAVQSVTLIDAQDQPSTETRLLDQLVAQRAVDYPGHLPVMAFAALYLGVLVLLVRRPDADQASSIGTHAVAFAVPLVFVAVATGLFHRVLFPQAPLLASLALVEPLDNSTLAELDLHIRLQSTRTDPLRVDYGGVSPQFRTVANTDSRYTTQAPPPPPTWIFEQDATPAITPRAALPYRTYSAQGNDIVSFDVDVHYRSDSGLELRNRSGRTLTGLWAFTHDRAFTLGTVADGETAHLRFDENQLQSNWRDQLRASHDGVAVATFDALLNGELSRRIRRDSDTDVLLLGFTRSPWQEHDTVKRDNLYLSVVAWRVDDSEGRP